MRERETRARGPTLGDHWRGHEDRDSFTTRETGMILISNARATSERSSTDKGKIARVQERRCDFIRDRNRRKEQATRWRALEKSLALSSCTRVFLCEKGRKGKTGKIVASRFDERRRTFGGRPQCAHSTESRPRTARIDQIPAGPLTPAGLQTPAIAIYDLLRTRFPAKSGGNWPEKARALLIHELLVHVGCIAKVRFARGQHTADKRYSPR